ncbi:hypothetical protein HYZ99_03875 [Candidatus Peregrinibacteria bacterium]|nr:hypothetical protein [Candidatus Peregrinibacteria bacterium]
MTLKPISRLSYLVGTSLFWASDVLAANPGGTIQTTNVKTTIELLEPVGGKSTVNIVPGLGTFFCYFNLLWPILIGSAAGIAVLMAVVGGLQIIMSGGDQGKRQEGLDRFKNALLGLLMCAFAGLLLRTLNPSFFKAGSAGVAGC